MVTTLDDAKRTAIATKLADMKAIQNLIISNEQRLISACDDSEISGRLQEMLNDDQKNLGILETAIVQYGVQSEPSDIVSRMLDKIEEMMSGSELSMYEKVFQHELLKHQQVMTGLLIHKAAQQVGADVEAAIGPLNTVNFENRAHQEQLKGVLESLGVRELTGQEADQGLWARVQDAVAAMSGVAGSVLTQSSDKSDMNIQDIIRMDHQKVRTLFMQIEQSNDPQKIQEYFGQLYKDLSVHAEAEEQVVYPAVRPFYGEEDTQELYDEQAQMKTLLEQIKSSDPSSSQFKDTVQQLKDIVLDHVRQEENTMFAAIRNNCSSEQSEKMATDFKAAKDRLQKEMAAS
ncbi:hemerythrin domain-containing protein [Pleurocapsales cyanobacterium LEGE 06147]|nr:hemerythrin domain-containing protein [Pleurocapsales cyanobacterium LEGE 06147]